MPITAPFNRMRPRSVAAGLIGLCAAGAIVGCGGSTSASSAPSQPAVIHHANRTAAQSDPDVGSARAQESANSPSSDASRSSRPTAPLVSGRATRHARPASRPAKIGRSGRVQRARVADQPDDDSSPTGAKALNPCTLVSRAQAAAVSGLDLGAGVEAPLGPTCVYQAGKSGSEITVALEILDVEQARRGLHNPERLTIKGRAAFCGGATRKTLVVPVRPGQVLTVSAPCRVAAQLASIVVGHLTA